MPKLQINLDERLMEFEIDGPAVIGRTDECQVPIADSEVSRQHCRIEPMEDRGWVLIDLGSRNGTLVNDQPVARHLLRSGDIMRVGKARIAFVEQEIDSERPPHHTGDPEIDEMLNELAPDPADYLPTTDAAGEPPSVPSASQPAAIPASATPARALSSARRQSWDQILGAPAPQPSARKNRKKSKPEESKRVFLGRLKSLFARINAGTNQRPLVLAAVAFTALLIAGYALYTTLFAGPKVDPASSAHISVRTHRVSDD